MLELFLYGVAYAVGSLLVYGLVVLDLTATVIFACKRYEIPFDVATEKLLNRLPKIRKIALGLSFFSFLALPGVMFIADWKRILLVYKFLGFRPILLKLKL